MSEAVAIVTLNPLSRLKGIETFFYLLMRMSGNKQPLNPLSRLKGIETKTLNKHVSLLNCNSESTFPFEGN